MLLNDPRFTNHPMVLETPKEKDLQEDIENLKLLRGLIRQSGQKQLLVPETASCALSALSSFVQILAVLLPR